MISINSTSEAVKLRPVLVCVASGQWSMVINALYLLPTVSGFPLILARTSMKIDLLKFFYKRSGDLPSPHPSIRFPCPISLPAICPGF